MNRRSQRGTQLVEFAVVLPLMVLIALVVAEGANMFRVHQLVTNAAREGARLASAPDNGVVGNPTTCTFSATTITTTNPVCNGIGTYLQNNGVIGNVFSQCSSVTVNLDRADNITTGTYTATYSNVQVSCPYQLQYLPRLAAIASTVTIGSASTFRNLY